MSILYEAETYPIRGGCYEVYRELGCGFLEAVYQESLAIEIGLRNIPFHQQVPLEIKYKNHLLKQKYVPDFICHGLMVVELKAVSELTDEHWAQVHNYLLASGLRLALLVNFGHHPKVECERIIR